MVLSPLSTLKRWWTTLRDWWLHVWNNLRPGPETGRGVFWAAVIVALVAACEGGVNLRSGFGLAIDLFFALLVALVGISLITLLVVMLLGIFRRLPAKLSGVVLGSALFLSLVLPASGFIFVPLAIFCGAALSTLVSGHFATAHISKKIAAVILGLASLATVVTLVTILAREGNEDDLVKVAPGTAEPALLQAPDPSQVGPLPVKMLFYGSGTDLRRPEYGATAALKTPTVDASPFFKDFKGWKQWLRRRYWGFGMDKLPLNARVWYPAGEGKFPLVLIVHGNHNMADFSETGYDYLGKLLASRGFIFASIDENFLNSGLFHDPPKQQAVRGWMLLEHLRLWRQWNAESGNLFAGKVDLDNIALMGHSRGGEAVATAALFNRLQFDPEDATIAFKDYGFHIKTLVAIAPADGQYKPTGAPRVIENVNYLTLQGANDGDVSSFMGSWQFDRVKLTEAPWFKAEIYAYRANHGQFNTVWGRSDAGEPLGRYLNTKPLLPPEEQRRISKTYVTAFLEATLKGKREYLPLFRDYRVGRAWLPQTLFANRYLDGTYQPIAEFREDADVTSTTLEGGRISAENLSVWREARIPSRSSDRGYNGVFLGWNRNHNDKIPVYSIALPDSKAEPRRQQRLVVSLAVTDEKAKEPGKNSSDKDEGDKKNGDDKSKDEVTDFTIELESVQGGKQALPLSRFGTLLPMFRVHFTKWGFLDEYAYEKAAEPVFQTFELPLKVFGMDDSRQLRTITLRFDKTVTKVVILSRVGLEQ